MNGMCTFDPASLHALAAEIFKLVSSSCGTSSEEWVEWLRVPLNCAVTSGNEDLVTRLLDTGGDVNRLDHLGRSTTLISAGADVNDRDPAEGCYPLHAAVRRGCDRVVADLLAAGAAPNNTDGEGISPLFLACHQGDESSVKNLLAAGAEFTFESCAGYVVIASEVFPNAEINVATQLGHVGVIKAFLEHGVDASSQACPASGWTALHQAALDNQAEAVEVLLEAGADADVESLPGSPCYDTPLLAAAESMSNEALRVLLRNGADPNKPDDNGSMPLHLAAHEQTPGVMEVVDLLLRWGASETAVNKHGNTPAEVFQRLAIHRPDATEERAGALVLLARAPADRAWRRRGWVVMLRARSETERIAAQRRGLFKFRRRSKHRRARVSQTGS
ncbi:similar to ankyrin 2,3/unc44 [Ectocarpus siliculosus]|uniref:Similar to ankyrin 2,3/unc44 n=1 Tax=Ectocarpus siliculosus TaxID=2880 RepID=D7FSI6_ECTSI|nr:similar to ankyrin 2,3/unc44 [Ectocarpus siliculosus]|eukprot:CBJ31127.1 similar to ankyrin 2,3/unc44 [Ectocarpus siliculosus]